jgi:hypothetical protein
MPHIVFFTCTTCGRTTRYAYEEHPYFEVPYGKTLAERVYQAATVPEQYRLVINIRYEGDQLITADDDVRRPCPHCGAAPRQVKRVPLRRITVSHTHPCDDRCKRAVSDTCTCSCGGANHGVDHRPTTGPLFR